MGGQVELLGQQFSEELHVAILGNDFLSSVEGGKEKLKQDLRTEYISRRGEMLWISREHESQSISDAIAIIDSWSEPLIPQATLLAFSLVDTHYYAADILRLIAKLEARGTKPILIIPPLVEEAFDLHYKRILTEIRGRDLGVLDLRVRRMNKEALKQSLELMPQLKSGIGKYLDQIVDGHTLSNDIPAFGYSIPIVDLDKEVGIHTLVDREKDVYLGHPTTTLLPDGKTIITVYPKGHGRGPIVMKKSYDAGQTWTDRLPVPESWASSQEVPTLFQTVDRAGIRRIIMFSGLYPIRMAHSEDDGITWSELDPIGEFGGIVAMGAVERLKDGSYMALFHDDGRFIKGEMIRGPFVLYKTLSSDGGLTWSDPEAIVSHDQAHLCEPAIIRSPDGNRLAVLMRENSRSMNSFIMLSDDEGKSWGNLRELPGALTGDRHTEVYTPDGRLFISFRDTTHDSPTWGDWVAWVGSWDDLLSGEEGEYRIRIKDNYKSADTTYPGVEILADGDIVTTTYGHWEVGEAPYILSAKFRLADLDALLNQ